MISHFFNFIHSSSKFTLILLFLLCLHFLSIIICIGSKATDFYFTSTHCSFWIDNNSKIWLKHSILMQFLVININSRKPTSVAWMRMIPSNTYLISSYYFHHIHEFLLINRINRFNTDSCTSLRH